jgi:hypothetical protein
MGRPDQLCNSAAVHGRGIFVLVVRSILVLFAALNVDNRYRRDKDMPRSHFLLHYGVVLIDTTRVEELRRKSDRKVERREVVYSQSTYIPDGLPACIARFQTIF